MLTQFQWIILLNHKYLFFVTFIVFIQKKLFLKVSNMKNFTVILILVLILLGSKNLFSQKEEVNKNLRLVAYGRIDEVRAAIPDLLAKYPNDPGVKLLHGTIVDDAFLALNIYSGIIRDFPESQWADHAYWRIIQFYSVLGDTAKAQAELASFRTRYPASPFIGPASDVVRSAVNLARKDLKATSNSAGMTKQSTPSVTQIKPEPIAQTKPQPIQKDKELINPDKIAANTDLSENVKKTQPTAQPIPKKDNNDNIEKLKPLGNSSPTVVKPEPSNETAKNNDNIAATTKKEETPKAEEKKEPEFFGLQVGIYKDQNTAESEKNKFLVRRLRTQVVEKDVNGVIMYAVVIGHYSSLDSAEEGKKIVSIQCGCEPIIYIK